MGGSVRTVRLRVAAATLATCAGVLGMQMPAGAAGGPPTTPSLTTLTPGDGQVALAWSPSQSDDPGTLEYDVDVRTLADTEVFAETTTEPSETITGLTNGDEYRSDIVARDTFASAEPLHVTPPPGRVPDQPTVAIAADVNSLHVAATAEDYGYAASWTYRFQPRAGGPAVVVDWPDPTYDLFTDERSGFVVTVVAHN